SESTSCHGGVWIAAATTSSSLLITAARYGGSLKSPRDESRVWQNPKIRVCFPPPSAREAAAAPREATTPSQRRRRHPAPCPPAPPPRSTLAAYAPCPSGRTTLQATRSAR